jgi:GNAT superfamily N-acetyltransferase
VEILTRPEAEVPPPLARQVRALQEQAWPPADPAGAATGHDPLLQPVVLLAVEDGRVQAALAVLSKRLAHRGERYEAAGLSAVVTDPAVRRRGFAAALIIAARRWMEENGKDLALFTCDASLAPFYESGGYEVLPGTVLVGGTPEDPFPSDRFDKATLWAPLTAHARDHAADFRNARIELHPGVIDRLW